MACGSLPHATPAPAERCCPNFCRLNQASKTVSPGDPLGNSRAGCRCKVDLLMLIRISSSVFAQGDSKVLQEAPSEFRYLYQQSCRTQIKAATRPDGPFWRVLSNLPNSMSFDEFKHTVTVLQAKPSCRTFWTSAKVFFSRMRRAARESQA